MQRELTLWAKALDSFSFVLAGTGGDIDGQVYVSRLYESHSL
jgi:hypothetical protein